MSVRLMAEVWANSPYTDAKLLIHLALADWANDDGTKCFPSHETIAAKTRCSKRTVERHLAAMRDDGCIEVISDSGTAKKGGSRYEYLVRATPPPPDNLSGGAPDNLSGGTRQSVGSHPTTATDDGSGAPLTARARVSTKEPSPNPAAVPAKRARTPRDDLFDALCAACGWEQPISRSHASRVSRLVTQLVEMDATPELVALKAKAYRAVMRDAILTPEALLKNWPTLNTLNVARAAGADQQLTAEAREAQRQQAIRDRIDNARRERERLREEAAGGN